MPCRSGPTCTVLVVSRSGKVPKVVSQQRAASATAPHSPCGPPRLYLAVSVPCRHRRHARISLQSKPIPPLARQSRRVPATFFFSTRGIQQAFFLAVAPYGCTLGSVVREVFQRGGSPDTANVSGSDVTRPTLDCSNPAGLRWAFISFVHILRRCRWDGPPETGVADETL